LNFFIKVKVLYVRNLMLSTSEDQIKDEFEKIKKGSIERVKKLKDFAFVHFKEREDAVNALKILNSRKKNRFYFHDLEEILIDILTFKISILTAPQLK
jgi:RNA recognition motif-containing protein